MLIRKTIQYYDPNILSFPFVIYNTSNLAVETHDEDVAEISKEELAAPALIIEPSYAEDDVTGEEFWRACVSSYKNAWLPPEIINAMQGKEGAWKVVRCQPDLDGAFFVIVNPELYTGEHFERNNLSDELEAGCVWANLNRERVSYYCLKFDVLALNEKDRRIRYGIGAYGSSLCFAEYDKRGNLWRTNKISRSDDIPCEIEVTEYC